MNYEVAINGAPPRRVEFAAPAKGSPQVTARIDGRKIDADVMRTSPSSYSVLIGGRSFEITVEENPNGLLLRLARSEFRVEIFDPRSWRRGRGGGLELEGRQQLTAPMPGKIVRVLVTPGQHVKAGEGLLVIEAMKMQNEVRSPKSGTVEKTVREGQTVNAGDVLAVVS